MSERRPRIISIINHVDSLNLGDASLLYMTVDAIRKALDPNKIFILSFDISNENTMMGVLDGDDIEFVPSPARTSMGNKVAIISEMLSFLVWSIIYRLTGRDFAYLVQNKGSYKALKNSELIIVRGGDNFADTYGSSSLIAHTYNTLLAILLRKRTIVLGTSMGPFKNIFWKNLALLVLRKVDLIVVRDLNSARMLENEGLGKKIHFIPDIAFELPAEPDKNYDVLFSSKNVIYVGVVTSSLLSKYLGMDHYVSLMARICDDILKNHNSRIVFVPHVLSHGLNDKKIAEMILGRMSGKQSATIIDELNPTKVKYVISKLDLLISPRMHPIIHALSVGVPVIGVDYNNKTREVMKLFDKQDWVIDYEKIDELHNLINSFFHERQENESFYKIIHLSTSQKYVSFLKRILV